MKLLILDGNSILNRAYYGIRPLTTKDGFYTNGIYGFLTMFDKIRNETEPNAVAIAFDVKAPTFRHKAYDKYKANRKGMPEELAMQLPVLKELLKAMGYKIVECEGWEADDILGTLAEKCREEKYECIIATGDRDSLQLVGGRVSVRLLSTKNGKPEATAYDEAKVREEYGVSPRSLIDIKAIQGDTSDNIPGVAGIGQKGATDLIVKFGSLKYIYDNIDEIDIRDSVRNKLIASKDNAFMSYMLGTIRTDAPVCSDLAEYIKKDANSEKTAEILTGLEFFSYLEKMKLAAVHESVEEKTNKDIDIRFLNSPGELPEGITEAIFSCSIENDSIGSMALFYNGTVYAFDTSASFLKSFFENPKILKKTHDIKSLYRILLKQKTGFEGAEFDTLLAAYLLNPSSSDYSLERLCASYCTSCDISSGLPLTDEIRNAAMLSILVPALEKEIELKEMRSLLQDIEIPLSFVLSEMEEQGFMVDKDKIASFGSELEVRIAVLEQDIYDLAGEMFNINSPKQLGVILFEKLGLPFAKKTKTGYSTGAEVLESLRGTDIVDAVLEYRKLTKLKSTYCDGLLKVISDDGRIHTSFNQTETRTGRISSTEPNLQNIPIRTELGGRVRECFIAPDGYCLCDADYSQIELRVLAHIADDKAMIDAFKSDDDIHTITASQVFSVPETMVTPVLRSRAKAVNFGIVYGIGAFSLAKDIGVSNAEASRYIKGYLSHYDGVREYMEKVVSEAKGTGYVKTMFNRRRYLPELSASNHNMRAFGERVARNMPIQGTAADIIKLAMINVRNRLMREKLEAKLVLQVHDELIIECPESEKEIVRTVLREEMENAVQLAVPLIVDVHSAKNWLAAK